MKRNEWFTASKTNGQGNCVEVMFTGTAVLLRDTKDKGTGPAHTFTLAEWDAFVDGVHKGEFDLPEGTLV